MQRILDLTADGPARLNKIMAESMPLVPPGKAYRLGLSQRLWEARRSGYNEQPNYDEEALIRRGRRAKVRRCIWSAEHSGLIRTFKDADGELWVERVKAKETA